MSRTVDLVIVGLTPAARAAAATAARAGRRVLVVDATTGTSRPRRFRRALAAEAEEASRLVAVLTGVEVACIAGTARIEAILLRRIATGRLIAVNATDLQFTSTPALHAGV